MNFGSMMIIWRPDELMMRPNYVKKTNKTNKASS